MHEKQTLLRANEFLSAAHPSEAQLDRITTALPPIVAAAVMTALTAMQRGATRAEVAQAEIAAHDAAAQAGPMLAGAQPQAAWRDAQRLLAFSVHRHAAWYESRPDGAR